MAGHIRVIDPSAYPFVRVDKAALEDASLSVYDLAVYVALCFYAANETSEAYPSMKTLGMRAKCSERQARSSIRVLEENGYIKTEHNVGGVNVYTLTRNKHMETSASHAEGSAHGAGGSAQHADDPGTVCRRTRLKELDSRTKDTPPTPQGGEESFDLEPEKPAKVPGKDGTLLQAIVDTYNKTLPELPKCDGVGKSIAKHLRARIREDPARKDLEWWRRYFEGIRQCPFLMGYVKDWRANFYWLTGPENMSKVLNGAYSTQSPYGGQGGRSRAGETAQQKYTKSGGEIDVLQYLRDTES